jgi:Chlorophyll A-B binding protein
VAFVSSFAPAVRAAQLTQSSLCGARVSPTHVAQRAAVSMSNSASVPFLPKPAACDGLVGSVDFDPLSLSTAFDIRWLQEGEIKNGRVAMLA